VKVEYWVVRVILTKRKDGKMIPLEFKRHLQAADDEVSTPELEHARNVVRAKIASEEWCVLPSDGIIGEPQEHFATQAEAQKHCALLAAKHPGEEFRVCINAEL